MITDPQASPTSSSEPSDGVWSELVGQARAIAELKRAVVVAAQCRTGWTGSNGATSQDSMHAMTHAWLFTGPPGSGRSVAARAFAAALECPQNGCGDCQVCRTCRAGTFPDVTICRTEQLSIGVDEIRDLVRKAAMAPLSGLWQVLIVEDADRITDRAADALLKSLEEPPSRTIWVLCTPNVDDLVATIRSRTREVRLVTPPDEDVVRLLVQRDGISEQDAWVAAKAAQGHIGRAKALAGDRQLRDARQRIVDLPGQWTSPATCLTSAAEIVAKAQADAKTQLAQLNQRERRALEEALGFTTTGARPRSATAALAQLEDEQKARAKRLQRDTLDNVLTELATWYQDVLAVQIGASRVINMASIDKVRQAADATTAGSTLANLQAILAARRAIEANVAPLLAIESLFVQLHSNDLARPLPLMTPDAE